MNFVTISGSSRLDSSNARLLNSLSFLLPQHHFEKIDWLNELPLFCANKDHHPWPKKVLEWRNKTKAAEAIIISTPEYIHNMPAVLKNALEWLTSSGELSQKKVLALTFTPHAPRGEKAMQSLLWSLKALDANIVGQLALYQNKIQFDEQGHILESEARNLLYDSIEYCITS